MAARQPASEAAGPHIDAIELRHDQAGAALRSVLRGSVADGRASGTVEMSLSNRGRNYDECGSGPVAWTAD